MADQHAAEPPPGTPGQRALGAMESAVRRARESAGDAPLPPSPAPGNQIPDRPGGPAPAPFAEARPTAETPRWAESPSRAGHDRWLIRSAAVLAALVVAGAVALLVSLLVSPGPPPSTAARAVQATTAPNRLPSTSPRGGKHGTTGSSSTTTPASASGSTTTVAAAPGGPPVISSLSPSSGSAGQSVTIIGSNFLSTSGQIVATFSGQVAPTSCPAQNTCTVTVPPSTAPSAQVVITTAGGASNAVTFTYG